MRITITIVVAMAISAATAADYPARPVRVIVASTPGGALDILSRMLAPAKTPQRIVDQLQADFAWVYAMPDMAARLVAQGFEADNPKPQATAKFIDAEIAKWGKVIKEGGIKGD